MRVLGLGLGSLRTYAVADQRLLAVLPAPWSYEEASAMPTVWVTVWMCLEELAGLSAGMNVLTQAATGGVGLVAMQCAQKAGARVCATAGRAEKRGYVQSMGVHMASTTRDSALFVVEIGSVLCGRLDVVLNSLTHDEYIPGAVAMAGEGARFMEIGKRGIWERSRMAREGVRYSVVAMDGQCALDPAWQHSALLALHARASAASQ